MCFISACTFAARPNAWAQVATLVSLAAAFIGVIILVVQGAIKWRKRGIRNLLSCLLLIAAFPIAGFCGHAIRSAIFSHDLHRWNEAVEWVKAHNRPDPDHRIALPSQYANLAYGVFYTHDDTCGLMSSTPYAATRPILSGPVHNSALNPGTAAVHSRVTGMKSRIDPCEHP